MDSNAKISTFFGDSKLSVSQLSLFRLHVMMIQAHCPERSSHSCRNSVACCHVHLLCALKRDINETYQAYPSITMPSRQTVCHAWWPSRVAWLGGDHFLQLEGVPWLPANSPRAFRRGQPMDTRGRASRISGVPTLPRLHFDDSWWQSAGEAMYVAVDHIERQTVQKWECGVQKLHETLIIYSPLLSITSTD